MAAFNCLLMQVKTTRYDCFLLEKELRDVSRTAEVVHGDARDVALDAPFDGVLTSPPYPGLIDYHEQHQYAYELLGLDDRRERELGGAARGLSRAAVEEYVTGISNVLRRCADALAPGAPVIVVVNDRCGLYPEILERSGLDLVDRLERHVNRRTGRRAGELLRIRVRRRKGSVRTAAS